MIQEWVKSVGRNEEGEFEPLPTKTKEPASAPRQSAQSNQCHICNNVFEDPEKWKWHETHHVGLGIFKCEYCNEFFNTSRKVFQHENEEHGVNGNVGVADPPQIPSDFQIL